MITFCLAKNLNIIDQKSPSLWPLLPFLSFWRQLPESVGVGPLSLFSLGARSRTRTLQVSRYRPLSAVCPWRYDHVCAQRSAFFLKPLHGIFKTDTPHFI